MTHWGSDPNFKSSRETLFPDCQESGCMWRWKSLGLPLPLSLFEIAMTCLKLQVKVPGSRPEHAELSAGRSWAAQPNLPGGISHCLSPRGSRCWVPPSLHALERQQVTRMEATDASRQQSAWQYAGALLMHSNLTQANLLENSSSSRFCRVFLRYFPRRCSVTSSALD